MKQNKKKTPNFTQNRGLRTKQFLKDQWAKTDKWKLSFSWIASLIVFWFITLYPVIHRNFSWINTLSTASAILVGINFLIFANRYLVFSFWFAIGIQALKKLKLGNRRLRSSWTHQSGGNIHHSGTKGFGSNHQKNQEKPFTLEAYSQVLREKSIIPCLSIGLVYLIVLIITIIVGLSMGII
ncbi:hypothetical protein J2Z62_000136 [Mycoplasmoides fastidiosum]|uniref:DUF3899 domain-containing protein n=1 Tax=Mycoplasmoides fastidiosum TaxID=92758 RepID=A0ABU0LYC0_9BACT|nr:hypothetical protein [Mycoplasmoides fastidiosum]MDQ0513698.1 hypothetical protein [Mycoplasmoides fastidiosum]UUD37879.1 hypothetical protein NPA10_00580 [Mycoplasmoides fastidiosum]